MVPTDPVQNLAEIRQIRGGGAVPVFISGMHSGQNPCSGLGIVRCLRDAFSPEQIRLIGVDHWQGSSGLHHDLLDEHWILPPWNQIQNRLHADAIRERLVAGAYWISAMDIEVRWLGRHLGTHPHLLAPPLEAVHRTAKPAVQAFDSMGFRIPEYISATEPDADIHAFLREHSWRCWIKSPFHEAARVPTWGALQTFRHKFSNQWKTKRLFVQRHIGGVEETFTFAAYQGELLGAVRMEKRQLTWEGKTWAGRVSELQGEHREALAECIRSTGWTGGGELELLKDNSGQYHIIECNPRFPAWLYGSAIAGHNLPGLLLSRAAGIEMRGAAVDRPRSAYFTRVVIEIPANSEIGIPMPPEPGSFVWSPDGKGLKGGGGAVALPTSQGDEDAAGDDSESDLTPDLPQDNPSVVSEIRRLLARFQGETPERLTLPENTRGIFHDLESRVRAASSERPRVRIGFSVKTSPTRFHLQTARECGFLAECISQLEVKRALATGFEPRNIILNGPGKYWPLTEAPRTGLSMVFCDSIEDFDRTTEISGIARTIGFRLRVPGIASRFGVPVEDPAIFRELVKRVSSLKGRADFGVHFHMPGWAIGLRRWTQALGSILGWCKTLESLSGVTVKRLDFGGGLFPDDLQRLNLSEIQKRVHQALPEVEELYFEPGRALTQSGEIVVSRVLDVRTQMEGRDRGVSECVADACIAELPLSAGAIRPVYLFRRSVGVPGDDGRLIRVKPGKARILGRICMEDDILAGSLDLPSDLREGDLLIFGNAGGYERSMSYGFGRG